jgi:hypothetical protein
VHGCALLLALATVALFLTLQGRAQQLAPVYVMNIVAGTGGTSYQTAPYTGDGGPGPLAVVSTPSDVVEDKYGNIFFLDDYNCVARVIYNSGTQVANLITLLNASNTNLTQPVVPVAGNIYTVAGVGNENATARNCGNQGDGGLATSAELNEPLGIEFDNAGNLLISDYNNQAIRKLNMTTGILTTVYGLLGTAGYAGDGQPAGSAMEFNQPSNLWVDQYGNIFIADYKNERIREINYLTGVISTVAGGDPAFANGTIGTTNDNNSSLAINAELSEPLGGTVDAAGNMLIGDYTPSAILGVNPSGIIYDVAGVIGTAGSTMGSGNLAIKSELDTPRWAQDDFKGNIIVADEVNRTIRLINPQGIFPNICGAVGTSNSGCPTSATGGSIGGVYTKIGSLMGSGIIATTTGAELYDQYTSKLDWANNIFLPNTHEGYVNEMTYNTQQPATAVGATSTAQNIFVQTNTAVTPMTAVMGPSAPAEFGVGALGLYLQQGTSFTAGPFTLGTSTLAANTPLITPITFKPAYPGLRVGQLTFTDSNNNLSSIGLTGVGIAPQVSFEYTSISTFAGNGTAGSAAGQVSAPQGGVTDAAGNIYFADSGNNQIKKITPAGLVTVLAGNGTAGYTGDKGQATAAELNKPAKVVIDYTGNLYIADTGNNVIRYVNAITGVISTIAGNGTAGYSGDKGVVTASNVEFNAPQGIAVDPGGRVYVADTGNNAIRYFGTGGYGLIATIVGNGTAGYSGDGGPAGNAELNGPTSITVDNFGDMYIADTGNDVIRVVTPGTNNMVTFGNITTFAGQQGQNENAGDGNVATAATLATPSDVALDAAGDVYIASGGAVRVVAATAIPGVPGVISTVAGTGTAGAYGGDGGLATLTVIPSAGNVAMDGAANLYIFDTAGNRVLKTPLGTPTTVNFGTANPGENSAAQIVVVTNTGNSPLIISGISAVATSGTNAQTTDFTINAGSSACTANTTLAAGQSCTINIAFTPATNDANGTVTGVLTVTDNTLNGTGVKQSIPLTAICKILIPTAITLSSNPVSPAYGTMYSVTAVLSGGGTGSNAPVGNLTFSVNGVPAQSSSLPANNTVSIKLTGSAAGTQTISASYSGDSNNASSSATDSVVVQAVPLTVKATNTSMTAGATPPSFTFSLSGFVNGDTSAAVTGVPVETSPVTPDTPAGAYPITIAQGTLAASNYSFTFVNGTLTVNPPLLPASGSLLFNTVPVISVIAGTGTDADGGNNGAATSANLESVHSVAVDKAGNIFLAETGDSVIREINGSTGVITIVAGLPGQTGFAGDGGLAVNALLYSPSGVSVDNNGNLLIADTSNQVIRFVNMTTGIISTIAGTGTSSATCTTGTTTTTTGGTCGTTGTTGTGGGTYGYAGDGGAATSALLYNPAHATSDAAGNVYIADYSNHAIRKVDAKTGIITTFAGQGAPGYQGDGGLASAAYLYDPADVEFDPAGNMLIAEYGNGVVRKINMKTGLISTVAGVGGNNIAFTAPPYSTANPCTAAVDNIGDNCLATQALFNHPRAAVGDAQGNIYVADEDNYFVRMINAETGIISIVAGTGTEGESGDGSIGANAEVSNVYGLALNPQGDLLIADPGNYVIRKLTLNQAFPTTKTASTSSFQNLYLTSGQAVTPAVAQLNTSEFKLNTLSCGMNVQLAAGVPCSAAIAFKPVQAGLQTAQFAVADGNKNAVAIGIYGFGNAPVAAFYSQGTISTIAGNGTAGNKGGTGSPASAALVSAPRGGVIDSRGNIYFADSANNMVRRISPTGGIVTLAGNGTAGYAGDGAAATAAELSAPAKVIVDPAGNLYIADTGNNVIRYVNVATGIISTVAGNGTAGYSGDYGPATSAELNQPQGLAIDLSGNVYIADTGNSAVRYFGLGGGINTITGTGTAGYSGDGSNAYGAQLSSPQAVALDLLGDVYIADTGNNVVRVITAPFNAISTFAGQSGTAANAGDGGTALAASLKAPTDIAFDPAGDLYIASGGQVRQVTGTGMIGTIAGTGGTGSYSGEGGPAANAVIPSPASNLIVDSSGNVYIVDTAGNRLLEVAVGNPAILNLGTQTPGSVGAAQVVTLQNTGNTAMTLKAISTSAGFVVETGNSTACSASNPVAAGASCTVSIAFSPASTATGVVTGTLTITDNALNASSTSQIVSLLGTAGTVATTTTTLNAAAASIVYGASTTVTATVAGSGNPTGTIEFTVNGTAIGSSALTSGKASITLPKSLLAGPATVTATYSGDSNNGSSAASSSITITPAKLTVTAANATFITGATALPVLSYTITGFVNGDTADNAVSGEPLEATTATIASPVGTYPITVSNPNSTLIAQNYSFTFVNGTLTVAPVPPADFVFTATPQNVFIVQASTAAVTLNLTPVYGYQGTITLSCGTLPKDVLCTFTSNTATTDSVGDAISTQLTISTNNQAAIAGAAVASTAKPSPFLFAFAIPLFGLGMLLRRSDRRSWRGRMLSLLLLGMLALGATSCTENIGMNITPTGTYQFSITAADSKAGISHTSTINLTVQAPAVE